MKYTLLGALFAAFVAGCCSEQPYMAKDRLARGLVVVLPGIEGRSGYNEAICRGLDAGGVVCAIELHDWTSSLGPLYNLRAYDRNRRMASQLGWRLTRYMWEYPECPVVLVGQSGGGAVALWTAEQMLPGYKVDGIVMLAASVSPKYVLEFALAKTREGIVNFYSPRDWLFLGLGTTVYGTMDGRHSHSAGQLGFEIMHNSPDARAYNKLYQVPWRPEMAASGNAGMHLTSGAEDFVARYVAPLVVAVSGKQKWSKELVEQVIGLEGVGHESPTTAPTLSVAHGTGSVVMNEPASQPATRPIRGPAMSQPAGQPASRPIDCPG